MTYSIVIPCWNEEKTIGRAVLETRAFFESLAAPFEIIVVDDGSADRTAETVQNLSKEIPELRLIRHEKNLGKGAAVKTGVAAASGEWILFLDADLSTHPSAFKKFLPHLAEADIVIGSRRSSGGNIAEPQPWMREKFGQLFNLTVRLLFRLPYRDTQCGFKAIRSSAKRIVADLATTGWIFDVELLARARASGLRIVEVGVTWRHGKESRIRVRDAWKIVRELATLSACLKNSRRMRGNVSRN